MRKKQTEVDNGRTASVAGFKEQGQKLVGDWLVGVLGSTFTFLCSWERKGNSARGMLCGFSKFGPKAWELSALQMHVKCSLLLVQALPGYPRPGKDNCSFPQLETGRGSIPHGSAVPSGLGKPGVQKSHGQKKEPLGGKARALGIAATAEDAEQLSSLYSCIRDQGHPIPSSTNMDVEGTNPLCSIPCVTSSGRICTVPLPDSPR